MRDRKKCKTVATGHPVMNALSQRAAKSTRRSILVKVTTALTTKTCLRTDHWGIEREGNIRSTAAIYRGKAPLGAGCRRQGILILNEIVAGQR